MSDAQTRFIINADDPNRPDVVELLRAHLAFAQEVTPEGHVHALPVHRMVDPGITLVSARDVGLLVGIGALKHLDDEHAEIKSMHTTEPARGQGVARALLNHLISIARERGYRRVSLETGTMPAFAPARSLYARAGFRTCPPFGEYTTNPHSVCMSLGLDA